MIEAANKRWDTNMRKKMSMDDQTYLTEQSPRTRIHSSISPKQRAHPNIRQEDPRLDNIVLNSLNADGIGQSNRLLKSINDGLAG